MNGIFARAFALFVPLAVAFTGAFAFGFWAAQQNYRQTGNDPQIQMAEDGAARLNAGGVPADLVPRSQRTINMTTSLAPWIAVYDASGTPLESSAILDGVPPHLPPGVFDPATWKNRYGLYGIGMPIPGGETRFSWQPRSAVRQAVVLVKADNGYFVAAGRNMREMEDRSGMLAQGTALLYFGTLAALYAAIVISIVLL